MKFILHFTHIARQALKDLKEDSGLKKQCKAVAKTLKFLSENPKHPGLQTHLYQSILGPNGEKIFEVYAEQNTPAGYRVFFYYDYGPRKGEITIFAIIPHP